MKAFGDLNVDVLVLGGGPAGAAAARALADGGAVAAMAERSSYERFRTGETLPPVTNSLFANLGLGHLLDGHLPSPGIVASWGSEAPHENDFVFSRHGHGWHLDRRRFDESLAREAAEAGATLLTNARAISCERSSVGKWEVIIATEGTTLTVAAKWIIDATGRSSWFTRSKGVDQLTYDRLVAVMAVLEDDPARTDHRAFIEAMPDGWWYASALPDGLAMAAYFTDSDLNDLRPGALADLWNDRLEASRLIASRLAGTRLSSGLRIVSCSTARAAFAAADGWLAVGDAARSIDPLSSQGISWALSSGLDAAGVVLNNDPASASALYESNWNEKFCNYLATRRAFYLAEGRWPSSPFWLRRREEPRAYGRPRPVTPLLHNRSPLSRKDQSHAH